VLDLTTCREVVRREIAADLARLERAPEEDWDRPTRLPAWSVRKLARHIAYGQELEAEAMRRAREGIPEAADAPTPGPDQGSILAAIRRNHEQLLAEMDQHTPESLGSTICPMYYGPVPGPFAVNVWAFEAGIHGNDLAAVLGGDLPLAPDVVQATATVLGASLPLLATAATERPASRIAFLLVGDTIRLDVRYDGASWQPGPGPAEETIRISGDDTAVLLFALGRIVLDHPGLAVSGSREEARRFKDYAPGP
jgi:uncharacterized protein (TIGR03083 family)